MSQRNFFSLKVKTLYLTLYHTGISDHIGVRGVVPKFNLILSQVLLTFLSLILSMFAQCQILLGKLDCLIPLKKK